MKTEWTSDDVVFIDFETVSLCDLRVAGGRRYAYDPTTRVLCCALNGAGRREDMVWVPDWVPLKLPETVLGHRVVRGLDWLGEYLGTATLCAHNALGFDGHMWERFIGTEVLWRDTSPLCRAAALPGGLNQACERLFDKNKDPKGRVLEVLSKAFLSAGKVRYPIGTAAAWVDLLEYCVNDVKLLVQLHSHVIEFAEPKLLQVDHDVNSRGFPIDRKFAARLIELQHEIAAQGRQEISELTEDDLRVEDASSTAKVKRWLENNGVVLPQRDGRPSLDRRDLRAFLEDPAEFCSEDNVETVAKVMALRDQVSRNTIGKATRMILTAVDGRARDQHVAYGAHTGRWTARAVQPHNFPRGVDGVDASLARVNLQLEEIEAEATRLGTTRADVLATLLRPCVAGDGLLSVADYGQVEARGICWLCDEFGALKFFADTTKDYYSDYVAPKIFGNVVIDSKKRWFAKQTGLGAGYGMSGKRMRAMLIASGTDFEAAGVVPEDIIKGYRTAHPKVVAGWKAMENAAKAALEGQVVEACRTQFSVRNGNLVLTLPSGRLVLYRDARMEMKIPVWGGQPIPTICYTHPRGWRNTLYGGRFAENICQAVCRDLLADALVRCSEEGIDVVMHVHDEIVTEQDTADRLAQLMSNAPTWAAGFPVLVESFSASRYFKKAPKGAATYRYMNGERV